MSFEKKVNTKIQSILTSELVDSIFYHRNICIAWATRRINSDSSGNANPIQDRNSLPPIVLYNRMYLHDSCETYESTVSMSKSTETLHLNSFADPYIHK